MGSHVIDARARSRAPRNVVWSVLADGRSWGRWGPWQTTELDLEGSPPPDGVGAVRRLTRRPLMTREGVTIFGPPSRLGYEMLSGLPLRDYRAQVTLSDTAAGTEIHWRSEFDAKIPGTGSLFRRLLSGFIGDVAERAAREAERRANA